MTYFYSFKSNRRGQNREIGNAASRVPGSGRKYTRAGIGLKLGLRKDLLGMRGLNLHGKVELSS